MNFTSAAGGQPKNAPSTIGNKALDKSQTTQALEFLTDRRVRLDSILEDLCSRLSGVLRAEGPENPNKETARESLVPVAEAIMVEGFRLDYLADKINDVLRRLEL